MQKNTLLRVVMSTIVYFGCNANEFLNNLNSDHIQIRRIHDQIIIEYTLDSECTQRFSDLVKNERKDPYKNWGYYKTFAKDALTKALPADLIDIIMHMKEHNEPTALIVHNMPIDIYIPATPTNGNQPPCKEYDENGIEINNSLAKGYISESMILGVCSILGAYPDFDEREKDGTYINQIIPRDDAKSRAAESSYGSGVPFHPHTENVYQVPPLKFFSLTCLRSDPKVATSIIFLDDILDYVKNHLPEGKSYEWFMEQIQKDQFLMKSGPSFENAKLEVQLPILMKTDKNERIYRFNSNVDRVEGITDDAKFVVEYLKDILKSKEFQNTCYTKMVLRKGDFLLFNNWEVMHAREAFAIDKDNWRWLQRCYCTLYEHAS